MTIHLHDTNAAIERGQVSQIEDAFRALVGWPKYDEITGGDAMERRAILRPVCEALLHDDRQMPGDIVTIFEDAEADLQDASYRAGAAAVLADLEFWKDRLGRAAA